jgi:dihydropteroate synthase
MGILNVTPDSFSDGGTHYSTDAAVERAMEMAQDGADIIDIGGESTRPGAVKVTVREELRRVMPVIERLAPELKIPISVDTYKSEVAQKAVEAGASIVNDITALRGDRRMAKLVAQSGAAVVLMHMKGSPRTMQRRPRYTDAVGEISLFLGERARFAKSCGIQSDRIIVDPGIGFGKRLQDNIEIIANLGEFVKLGYPVLAGPSRKSFIGEILGVGPTERFEGTLAAVTACVLNGADIVRVHDVKEAVRAVRVAEVLRRNG